MSRNLVKQFWAVEAEEKRVIDTNELLRRRGENSQANAAVQADEAADGFVGGLGAEEVELPEGQEFGAEGGVIKAGPDAEAMLERARAEAGDILNRAKEEAAAIIADAKSRAEEERKSIREQARQQGYEDGQASARAEADAVRNEFQEKSRRLEEEYQKLMDELEPKFIDTVTSVYEHIFQVDLSGNRDVLTHLISNTMHKLEGGGTFLIHVSKEDYSYVVMQKKQILAGTASNAGNVEIVEDVTLGKNECLIETDSGIFDCGLGTQLNGLKQKLRLLSWSGEE